jgi:serine/threonine-protein kinase HipA
MSRATGMRRLVLWMNGERVGTWSILRGKDQLEYEDSWLQSPQARPLSLTLPFTPGNQPHRGELVGAWFDNLLPDSLRLRERIAARFKTKGKSAFDLLAEVGRESVGAIRLLPEGFEAKDVRAIHAQPMPDAEIAQLLRNTSSTQPWSGEDKHADDFRISLAGAQEKTALLRLNGQWMRPLEATPTTHILKLPLGLVGNMQMDMAASVENEWICAQVLKAYGLPAAECEMAQFEDIKVLVVERFDRVWSADSSWLIRLPQEDMCQAMGYPSHMKYESDGGPGMDKILNLLNGSTNADQDKINFIKAQFIFWLLCASDGHAKNFSIQLKAGGSYAMAPLYDVLSVYPVLGEGTNLVSPHQVRLAMAMRGKSPHWKMREIQPRHWHELAKRHGVPCAGADSPFEQIIEQTPAVIAIVQAVLPAGFPPHVSDPILKGLEGAAKRFVQTAPH